VYSLPNAAACTDCNGVLKGDAVLDQCGVCDNDASNDDSSCKGCTNPSFTQYSATATIDDGTCASPRDKQSRLVELRGEGNTAGSAAAKTHRKTLLKTMMRSKTRPATQSRKDFVKESRLELEQADLSETTKNRLPAKKVVNRVFHSMGPQNKDVQVTNWAEECAGGDCCHIDFSNQTATDLQIIEPDDEVGSWVIACNGNTPQCMQTRLSDTQFTMQEYTDSGWGGAVTKNTNELHTCGSNLVVIGSMEGVCGSTADCGGGTCQQDTAETYTCQCTAPACGEQCGDTLDECGVCDGDGILAGDCDCNGNVNDECGVCGGTGYPDGACDCDGNSLDACGVCDGDGSTCAGCDGFANSGLVNDDCGVCGGDGALCGAAIAVEYGGEVRTVEACAGNLVEVSWVQGSHDIEEAADATCGGDSIDDIESTFLVPDAKRNYDIGAQPGETRYFRCSAHCGANANRIVVTCPAPPAPAGPSTCPANTTGLSASEFINAQCCTC